MLWSGSKPLTVVRESMWGFLMFAGVAWLAISWSVLRLEPTDIVRVAGPVVLFGALTEAVRALAGTRTWGLNAGMAALFTATGVVLLTSGDSSYTTPAALIGWYLMVRGAADVAVSMMTRETDRIWGLLMVVGVLETGLGFFSASPLSRTADLVVTVLGGLALARGVADLVAALRLREAGVARADILDLPPERAAGVAGYSAGLTDFETQPPAATPVRTGPRHRAAPRSAAGSGSGSAGSGSGLRNSAAGMSELSRAAGSPAPGAPDLDPAGGAGATVAGGARADLGDAGGYSDRDAGADLTAGAGRYPNRDVGADLAGGYAASDSDGTSFHDEVLRTTADLDAMLALAGVTGAGVAAGMAEHFHLPPVPDTPEGAELPSDSDTPAETATHEQPDQQAGAPLPDPKSRAAQTTSPGMDDTSIIAGGRLAD